MEPAASPTRAAIRHGPGGGRGPDRLGYTASVKPFHAPDDIRAIDAKLEAQRIAFGPIAFQATRALRDLGILGAVAKAQAEGIAAAPLARSLGLSVYGVGVLLEMGLGLGLVRLRDADEPPRFVLGKVGHFVLNDELTRVNMDFVGDVCYQGAAALGPAVRSGKPEGLKVFGDWATIYEGLASLPEPVRRSWFAFDHFYSDAAFPDALPIVFARPVERLMDVGGNTARWALACCRHDPRVRVTIVDLPGQLAEARRNVEAAGCADRVSGHALDVLAADAVFPTGADAVWMSQFLDCFSLSEIESIMARLRPSIGDETDVYVLEPLWDRQRFEAARFSLLATSLYFTCMANGDSKMYSHDALVAAVERPGYALAEAKHQLGPNDYSLLRFRRRG